MSSSLKPLDFPSFTPSLLRLMQYTTQLEKLTSREYEGLIGNLWSRKCICSSVPAAFWCSLTSPRNDGTPAQPGVGRRSLIPKLVAAVLSSRPRGTTLIPSLFPQPAFVSRAQKPGQQPSQQRRTGLKLAHAPLGHCVHPRGLARRTPGKGRLRGHWAKDLSRGGPAVTHRRLAGPARLRAGQGSGHPLRGHPGPAEWQSPRRLCWRGAGGERQRGVRGGRVPRGWFVCARACG